jgi:hypothetical protein
LPEFESPGSFEVFGSTAAQPGSVRPGFAGDGVKDNMGIIRPFAVSMRYPDMVVVAERGGAARLLLIISVVDRDCGPAPSTA